MGSYQAQADQWVNQIMIAIANWSTAAAVASTAPARRSSRRRRHGIKNASAGVNLAAPIGDGQQVLVAARGSPLGASGAVTALGRALAAAERRGWIRLRVGSPAS